METCIRMMLLGIFSLGFLWTPSVEAFSGCHQFCGNKANKAWWDYMNSQGITSTSTAAQKAPFTAEADRRKTAEFNSCMDQTLAEGKTSDAECNGEAAPSGVPTPTANPNRCVSEYQQYLQACEQQASTAVSSCDDKSSSAFSGVSGNSDASATGVTDACQQSASLSTSARDAWTNFRNTCSSSIGTCLSSCSALSDWANANSSCFPGGVLNVNGQSVTKASISSSVVSPKSSQCSALQSQVSVADSNISNYSQNATTSEECQASTSGGNGGGNNDKNKGGLGLDANSLASIISQLAAKTPKAEAAANAATFCQNYPTYPSCSNPSAVNCSDPNQAATNKVCLCSLMPRDPQCSGGSYSAASEIKTAYDGSSSRVKNQNTSADMGGLPDMSAADINPDGNRPTSNSVQGVDGRQGGAAVGNANLSGNVNPSGSGGGGGANVDPAAPSGYFGGGGGGGSGRSFASAGGGSNYSGARPPGAVGGPNAGSNGPDLRQFLPGGMQDPRARGMAGGVGKDGITGPHTSNWSKVQNRYRLLQDTLHP